MNKDDRGFLIDLQNRLKTQETDYQASPVYWAVAEHKQIGGVEDGYEDGSVLLDDSNETIGNSNDIEKIIKDLYDLGYFEQEDVDNMLEEKQEGYFGLTDIIDKLEASGHYGFKIGRYIEDEDYLAHNAGCFLTKEACKNHIKQNYYHYTKPHTYAMTAWRNPEFERVLKILTETDWSNQ